MTSSRTAFAEVSKNAHVSAMAITRRIETLSFFRFLPNKERIPVENTFTPTIPKWGLWDGFYDFLRPGVSTPAHCEMNQVHLSVAIESSFMATSAAIPAICTATVLEAPRFVTTSALLPSGFCTAM